MKKEKGDPAVKLTYVSPDGEGGYPGQVTLTVTYTLTADNALRIDYQGMSDKPTLLNPTHHSYFNLSGDPTQTILDEQLTIDADQTTVVGAGLIPTGKLADVAGTPLDFRQPAKIGARIDASDEQLALGKGYDHNWVLRHHDGEVHKVPSSRLPERHRPAGPHQSAGPAVLFGQLPGRHPRQAGHRLSAAHGSVSGDAAVPGRAQPPGLPLRRAPAGASLQADHHLQFSTTR